MSQILILGLSFYFMKNNVALSMYYFEHLNIFFLNVIDPLKIYIKNLRTNPDSNSFRCESYIHPHSNNQS